MTVTSPLAVAEPWDLVAAGYADEATEIMLPFSLRAFELAQLGPATRVLDVAAGPGTLALAIAPRVASVTAVDFASAMVEGLRARAEAQRFTNLRVIQADGQSLPLSDAAFDAAFSMFGWMFFPDRARGLAEIRRVLVPGGRVVVSSWAPVARSPLMSAMFGALRAADPEMPAPAYDPKSLENPEQLASELRSADLTDVDVVEHTASVSFSGVDELWTRMVRSSAPLAMMRKRLGEALWTERSALAQAHLKRELGPKPTALTTTAWLGVARRS
jgi:ubiquinone/menaquinone biosynthesis C-methylase UbiE